VRRYLLAAVFLSAARAGAQGPELDADLWFRATAAGSDAWAGLMRVQVKTSVEDGREIVTWSEDGQLAGAGTERGWREVWTLDPDLAVVRGFSRWREGDSEIEIETSFDGQTLVRTMRSPALEVREPWSRERPCWPARLGLVAMRRRFSNWEPGRTLEALVLAHEEGGRDEEGWPSAGPVPSSHRIAVKIRSRASRPVLDKDLDCWTLEVPGPDGPVAVTVDERGLPVEEAGAGHTLRRVAGEAEAKRGAPPGWSPAGRRDPFRAPLAPSSRRVIERGGPGPEAPKSLSAEVAREKLEEAQRRLDAMRAAGSLTADRKDEVMGQEHADLMVLAGQLRAGADPESVRRVNEIVAAAAKLFDPVRAAVAGARSTAKTVAKHFESGEKAQLQQIAGLVESLRVIATGAELAGRPEQASVAALLAESEALGRRALVILEGRDRLAGMEPTGIMSVASPEPFEVTLGIALLGSRMATTAEVRLPVSRSVVFMGGGSYEEGEAVPGLEETFVERIRPEAVTVRYKGERFSLKMKR
jgi:hypothetical protein